MTPKSQKSLPRPNRSEGGASRQLSLGWGEMGAGRRGAASAPSGIGTFQGEARAFPRFVGGADENGLGPRLGPLVVTGVLASAADEKALSEVSGPPSDALSHLIGDSKRLVGFGHSALGEAWARVLCASKGISCKTPAELIEHLSIEAPETCRSDCPASARPLCRVPFEHTEDAFEAPESVVEAVRSAHAALEQRGIRLISVRSAVVCTRTLNDERARGVGRLDVDLHCMERLFFALKEECGASPLTFLCGKVGGLSFYQGRFAAFCPAPARCHFESREVSAYTSSDGDEMRFVLDAEPKHQLTALASLVGKWLRDFLMRRLLNHLSSGHPEWPRASGYNDPTTKELIRLSETRRREWNLPDSCFLRG